MFDSLLIPPRVGLAVKSAVFGVPALDCWEFELAIDLARGGRLKPLFEYFKLPVPAKYLDMNVAVFAELTTDRWRARLPAVRQVIRELRSMGH